MLQAHGDHQRWREIRSRGKRSECMLDLAGQEIGQALTKDKAFQTKGQIEQRDEEEKEVAQAT